MGAVSVALPAVALPDRRNGYRPVGRLIHEQALSRPAGRSGDARRTSRVVASPPRQQFARRPCFCVGGLGYGGQPDPERGTTRFSRTQIERATVLGNDPAGNRQAKARAARLVAGSFTAVKALEDA